MFQSQEFSEVFTFFLSFSLTLHIHLIIIISVWFSFNSCSTFIGQVSLPCIRPSICKTRKNHDSHTHTDYRLTEGWTSSLLPHSIPSALSSSILVASTSPIWFSLRFNGEQTIDWQPVLAGVYWSKGWRRWWWQLDYWSYKSCKAPVKSSPPTSSFFTGRMPFLSPNQQCQSTEGGKYHIPRTAYPKLTLRSSNVFDH